MAGENESVQPDAGQGGSGGDSPYADYLNRIPEEVRGQVEPVFRDWDSNTTKRFQEAAEYRRGWEPFEQMGVQKRDPAEVEWALQLADAAMHNPAAIQEWYGNYATERGLTSSQQQQQPGPQEDAYVDPSTQSFLEAQLQKTLGPVASQLAELAQWREAQERQAAEERAMNQIQSEMADLKAKHPDDFNESMVEKLLPQYIESDPQHAVARAFADWQAIRNQIEQNTMSAKASQGPGAVSGGSADGAPEPITSLKQAAAAAMQQLRADRGA